MRRWVAIVALLPWGISGGTVPVSAQAALPSTFACSPASTSAPMVCSGKVPSWDGVPLDADLTIPPGRVTPRPLIVMLHGYANQKTEWESSSASNSNPDKDHYNNFWFASQGYAVLTYTARGFHGSCGQGPLQGPGCARGWMHLADRRFEVRDTQYLAGLLADAGVADPQRVGVTGGSYGGGQSLLLAVQGDQVATVPDASNPATYDQATLKAWTSPVRHLAMHLAAVVPKYPWSDLVDSLLPNGRASDGVLLPDGDRLSPVGVEKQSYVSYFYFSGNAPNGYYCPQPCLDASANITAWFARVNAGEPYDPATDPLVASAIDQLKTWKSPYYQDALIARTKNLVPVFDIQGWTDQLFPEVEGVSLVNKLRAHGWPVKVAVADVGHPIAQNKAVAWSALNAQANTFLDHYLKGADAPALDASAQVTTCDATVGTTYAQPDWASLAPYRVSFASTIPQATASATDQPAGPPADPITVAAAHQGSGACVVLPAASTAVNGHWDFTVTRPFTLLGEPAVHLEAAIAGIDAEIDPLLWDVAPDGSATLVTRGAYRFIGTPGAASIDAPLQGNGWDFLTGHTIRLEVTQNDAPYLRMNNLASAIVYSSVRLTLPTPTVPAT
jgi:predicted acyl esterase